MLLNYWLILIVLFLSAPTNDFSKNSVTLAELKTMRFIALA